MIITATTPEETIKEIVVYLRNQASFSRVDAAKAERKITQSQKKFQAEIYENMAKFVENIKVQRA